jgi:hypothetical protein
MIGAMVGALSAANFTRSCSLQARSPHRFRLSSCFFTVVHSVGHRRSQAEYGGRSFPLHFFVLLPEFLTGRAVRIGAIQRAIALHFLVGWKAGSGCHWWGLLEQDLVHRLQETVPYWGAAEHCVKQK